MKKRERIEWVRFLLEECGRVEAAENPGSHFKLIQNCSHYPYDERK